MKSGWTPSLLTSIRLASHNIRFWHNTFLSFIRSQSDSIRYSILVLFVYSNPRSTSLSLTLWNRWVGILGPCSTCAAVPSVSTWEFHATQLSIHWTFLALLKTTYSFTIVVSSAENSEAHGIAFRIVMWKWRGLLSQQGMFLTRSLCVFWIYQ